MFDPFGDFDTAGYLRNAYQIKDLDQIRQMEHSLFLGNMPDAIEFLAQLPEITFEDYLRVHGILFRSLYPWAGQSRLQIAPDVAISKGEVQFCHPRDVQRAIGHGLGLAGEGAFRQAPGQAMGMFAWGHPFLDGNGRAMLLVHNELCYRAGFSIDWIRTDKDAYLSALTQELKTPNARALDNYLREFIGPKVERGAWNEAIKSIKGLDGQAADVVEASTYDEGVMAKYQEFERQRGYQIPESKPRVEGE